MKKKLLAVCVLCLFALLLPQVLVADRVYLNDGTRITGKVLDKGDKIEVETEYGRLTIDRADISRIEKSTEPAPKPPASLPKTSEEVKKAILDSITSKELSDHIHYFASNLLEGRGTGDKGGELARDYIAKQFKSYGLAPGGDTETYTQKFPTSLGDSWNVIGYLEGSDPVASKQVVIVGAHYDHLGKGKYGSRAGRAGRGKIHPGADDNASGTAGVLEIAESFAEKGIKPKRTILFICFGAEEIGLVGSRYYCKNPKFPLENTVAMLNMDMISRGRSDSVIVYGIALSPQLDKLLDNANHANIDIRKGGMAPFSDHWSFYRSNVPAIMFCTGMNPDLHMPTDTPDKCDFKKAEKIAEMVALTTCSTANYDGAIEMDMSSRGRFARKARLGVYPKAAEFTEEIRKKFNLDEADGGIRVERVVPGSAAEKGGLKKNDIIIEFNGEKLSRAGALTQFHSMVRKAKKNKEIPYTAIRNGQKKTGTVTLR